MAADNKTLGNFQLTDIPAAPRGVPQIKELHLISIRTVLLMFLLKIKELTRSKTSLSSLTQA